MTNLATALAVRSGLRRSPERASTPIDFNTWAGLINQFTFQGVNYTLPGENRERIGGDYQALARFAYKSNGVVYACEAVRLALFSELRFAYRRLRSGRTGDLWGDGSLRIVEEPWPGGGTRDLLKRMLICRDLGGNAFAVRRGRADMISVLRPDWVDFVIGGPPGADAEDYGAWAVDSRVVGYAYWPGGRWKGEPELYFAEEVAHFAADPDPEAQFRGMSWLTPVIREIESDASMTGFKDTFFNHSATPNLIVKFDTSDLEKWTAYIERWREEHEGVENFGKTMFLASGMDATVAGANLEQVQFKLTQGAGETRIAAAASVPPVIVGLSEGLQAATYSNYGQARRRLADGTLRPLWGDVSKSLERIVRPPSVTDSELWYDESGISFLKEDLKDAADIQGQESTTIRRLVDGGFEPKSVIAAVRAGDWNLLRHTGLTSVQLQPPKTEAEANAPAAANGNAPPAPPSGSRSDGSGGLVLEPFVPISDRGGS